LTTLSGDYLIVQVDKLTTVSSKLSKLGRRVAGQLADTEVTGLAMKEYVDTKHMKLPYVPWRKGVLRGACLVKNDGRHVPRRGNNLKGAKDF